MTEFATLPPVPFGATQVCGPVPFAFGGGGGGGGVFAGTRVGGYTVDARKVGPVAVPHGCYHEPWPLAYLQNSRRGNEEARRQGKHWLDNDFGRSSDGAAINRHDWPETIWGKARTWQKPAKYWKAKRAKRNGVTYHVRDAWESFRDAHAFGQSVEAEIKKLSPKSTRAEIRSLLERLKRQAIARFGDQWNARVQIKVVSTMGRKGFADDVCEIAHELEFTTILSVRGADRFKRYTGRTDISYVRGSAVIR